LGSDAISLGFTVKQLKNQLIELGLKASGVKKKELEQRLLSNGHRFRNEFTSTGYREEIKKRPLGKRFPLGGLTSELEQSFGIRSRGEEKNDLRVFESTSTNKTGSSTSVCLRHDDYLTNKKICSFCSFWDSCKDLEYQTSQDSQTYIFETVQNNFNSKDIQIIKEWFDNRSDTELGLIGQNMMIFSNNSDPFKPGFGIKAHQLYFVSRLSEYMHNKSPEVSQWSHLYHSEILSRTLTIFEAVYLNSAVFQAIFSLNSDGTYEESFPTLNQVELFFKTGLNLRDLNKRKSIDKKRMIEGLENNDLLGSNTGSLEKNDPFLFDLIRNTQDKFNQGFFDNKLEIFSKYEDGKSFKQHLVDLWSEIGEVALNTTIGDKDNTLFQPRIQAQLLIPPVDSFDTDGLVLPNNAQILRVKDLVGLKEPWILTTEKINLEQSKRTHMHRFFPDLWLKFKWIPPLSFIKQLRDSPRKYNTEVWPNRSSSKDGTQLNIFLAKDVYSAFAMNTLQNKYTNSLGDINQKKNHERFHNIMYDLFFRLLHERRTVRDVEFYEYLTEFWKEFTHPKYKRLKPLVALRKLSEFEFNTESIEPLNTRFLEFRKETTPYGKHIETLYIKSPSYHDENDVMIESFTWEIKLAWKYDVDGIQIFENAGNWKVVHKRGREISLEMSKRKMIEQLLSWKPTSEHEVTQDVQNVFLSPMICKILEENSRTTQDLIWRLIEILNQKAVYSCPIIFLETEYDILQAYAGQLNIVKVKQYSEDMVLCVAHSLMPVTYMSPNFLHVGALN